VAAVLDGVKVVEVAGWTFVPAGGGVLADWGADVIKIDPVQFDETPPELTRAPDAGEHTDEILEKELGLDWDAIVALKLNNTVN
jgi:crotonobetainyl-CoA:carnitine CoA-transferase CaiB-like acyl-CoA transferase